VPPGAVSSSSPSTSQLPRIVVVIPARYASTRLPAKPLAEIAGRPMIEHVYRRAAATPGVDAVVVATDDRRIAAAVEAFGGTAQMTDAGHQTGSDRIAEVARTLACEILVNVQGDLPLIEPEMIAEVIAPLAADPSLTMATLRQRIAAAEEYVSPHVVKVVVDARGDALYFSRSPIPNRPAHAAGGPAAAFKHIGLYAYRREFLLTFAALPRTPLEQAESLEQLRALEHGYRIRTVLTTRSSIEVDTPDDLERVRRTLAVEART
jgi:3-deoxy-manno-octulosonate cytidylyltransferase (CMP-KDO synthetase)